MLRVFLAFLSIAVSGSAISNSPNPWFDIRKERISQLLPLAMQKAKTDAWIVLCRENNNDPLAMHIGCENAGKTAAFVFYFQNEEFHSVAYSPIGEATALAEANIVKTVVPVPRTESAIDLATAMIKKYAFEQIAVNMSENNAQADGLSFMQHKKLSNALGPELAKRLVSSDELVYQWLAIKLPQEVEIMRQAAELTAKWQLEAYASVVPGVTSDADLAVFLKKKMADAGVTDAWASDQNPNVNSGTDRGHSHATDKIIQPGDVIQTDFGIRVHDTWVTDIQRFAYVLRENETEPPGDILRYWEGAKNGREAAFKAMKPGAKGIDVDAAQRAIMENNGSLPVMWSTGHPVGYVAHDTGPNLGGSKSPSLRPAAQRVLQEGMTFAFDGFYSWLLDDGKPKTISVEEMVVINSTGAEYLIPPQQDLILIRSHKE